MAGTTTNYGFNKPTADEFYDISVQNVNWDKNDAQLLANLLETKRYTDEKISDLTQDRIYYCGTTSGTNTYTAVNSKIAAYTDGLTVRVKIGNASTGASTLNINGLGAKTILDTLGNPITSGGLKAGLPYQLCYNGTNFIVLGKGGGGTADASKILAPYSATVDGGQVTGTIPSKAAATYNPSTTAQTISSGQYLSGAQTINPVTGTANTAQVLSGYTFASANGIGLTGTIPSKVAATITPGTSDQTIIAGQYLSGVQTIKGDTNLVAANIISGKTIFGVGGNAQNVSVASGTNIYNVDASNNASFSIPIGFIPDIISFHINYGNQYYDGSLWDYKNGVTQQSRNRTSIQNFANGTTLTGTIYVSSTGTNKTVYLEYSCIKYN